MEPDNYQPAKPIEVNQWTRKLTLLIMPPDIEFIAKARLPARQTAMSWDRSRMLNPTTAKNMNKRMHHDCRRHTHLSKTSAFRRMQLTGTQSHIKTDSIAMLQKYQWTCLNQKTDGLDTWYWNHKFYTDETAIPGIGELLSPGVSSIDVSAIVNEFAFPDKRPESWEIRRFGNAAWPILFSAGATRSPIDGRHD